MTLDFACAAYGLLVRVLTQMFGRADKTMKELLVAAAFSLMHAMAEPSDRLVRLPANSAPGVNAGMSFTMLRGVEPLLQGPSEALRLTEQAAALARGPHALDLRSTSSLSTLATDITQTC